MVPGAAGHRIRRRITVDRNRQDHPARTARPVAPTRGMQMPELDIRAKAERISALFRECRQIDILPPDLMPADLQEAYAIRAAFEDIEIARGRGAVVGYKIGLTTPIMQKLCGVDEPCYGAIFATEVHHGRAELPVARYCRLGIETEIAVRLGKDLPHGSGGGGDHIAPAVESCMAAI